MPNGENVSAIPGHTALPLTTTYQDLVVDSYTNLRERYQCTIAVGADIGNSNNFIPMFEGEVSS